MKKRIWIICSVILLSLTVCINASAYVNNTVWQGSVSFPITITAMAVDNHNNIVYQKLHKTFTGTLTLYTVIGGGMCDTSTCPGVPFPIDFEDTTNGIYIVIIPDFTATIWTDHGLKPTSESGRLIGQGLFSVTVNGITYTDIANIDISVTLSEDKFDYVTKISARGKIVGGTTAVSVNGNTTQGGFIFDANFSATLYPK